MSRETRIKELKQLREKQQREAIAKRKNDSQQKKSILITSTPVVVNAVSAPTISTNSTNIPVPVSVSATVNVANAATKPIVQRASSFRAIRASLTSTSATSQPAKKPCACSRYNGLRKGR
jgi:hypothetical protein